MATTQIHGVRQIKPGTINDTLVDASIIVADGGNAFTGDQSMGGFKITNLGTPAADSDAATKLYVDQARAGLLVKDPVRVATTANITLSGTQTIDGVALSAGNRVLVKDQSTGADNGLYSVSGGAWTRTTDADVSSEVKAGLAVWVNEGTANGDKRFVLTTDDPITLGSTALVFTQDMGGSSYTAGNGLTLTGNTFDVVAGDSSITVNANDLVVNPSATGGLEVSSGLKIKLDGSSLILGSSGIKTNPAKFITRESPSGAINGSNTAYALGNTPVAGSEHVFLNGLLQEAGGEDYSISAATITFVTAPVSGDRIRVSYMIA